MRYSLPAVLLLCSAGALSGQGTHVFQGRLVHVDGLPTANLTVAFSGFGSTVTSSRGQFSTALPAGVAEVEVEILDHDWAVLYPRDGRVPVPRDGNQVVEIMVGESVEAAALRLFAERHEKLAAGLSAVGAGQDEIRSILQTFVDEVSHRLAIDSVEFNRQVERERERAAHFPRLSATIRGYIVEAKDLTEFFKRYGSIAFRDREAYAALQGTVERYNDAFQTLNNERLAFEYQVATFWESEELRSDLRALYDFALGEVHDLRILQLNESMPVMHQALFGGLRDRQRIQQAQQQIAGLVRELELRIPEMERRAERVLAYLARN